MSPKKLLPALTVFTTIAIILLTNAALSAAEETQSVSSLKKQVEALQKKVDQLEAEKKDSFRAPDPSFNNGPNWDPFEEIDRMQENIDQMFQNSFGRAGNKQGIFSGNMNFNPDLNLKETPDGYEIKFDITGLNKDKVDVQINENSLTIKGEQSIQNKEESPDKFFSSQSFGSFVKTVPLPTDADTTKIKSEKQGDTLVIRLPKKSK